MSPDQLWGEREQLQAAVRSELKQKWTKLGIIGGFVFGLGLISWVRATWAGEYNEANIMLGGMSMLATLLVAFLSQRTDSPELDSHREQLKAVRAELSRQGVPKRRPGTRPPAPWEQ